MAKPPISSKDKRLWFSADNCLKTCNYSGNNLGHINHPWFPMMWSKPFTPLTCPNESGRGAHCNSFHSLQLLPLSCRTFWQGQHSSLGQDCLWLPSRTPWTLEYKALKWQGREKRVFPSFATQHFIKERKWNWVCIWLKMCYKKVSIPSSIASAFQGVSVMTSSVELV